MVVPESRIQDHLVRVTTTMGGVITGFETTTGRIIQLELGLQKKSMPEISLDDE